MFGKAAGAAAGIALCAFAGATQASDFSLVDWNGAEVWATKWTQDTKLSWDTASVGLWYRIYFEGYTDGYMNGDAILPGLASTVLFKLSDISTNQKNWTFDYVVENASNQWVNESRVSAFGFDVSPNVKSSGGVQLHAGGEYRTVGKGDFDPTNNLLIDDDFDVCFTTKGSFYGQPTNTSSNCDPGQSVGPELGESGSGTFTLRFSSAKNELYFDNPFVAYDDVEFTQPNTRTSKGGSWYDNKYGYGHMHDSRCGHGKDDGGYGLPVAVVPEPSTWAMMILGFGLAGAALRRRGLVGA
jgi:hypothetical protein